MEQGTAAQFERRIALRSELTDLLNRHHPRTAREHEAVAGARNDAGYVQAVASTLNRRRVPAQRGDTADRADPGSRGRGRVQRRSRRRARQHGDLVRAETYCRRAIHAARGPSQQTMSQRSFAQFLFSIGRVAEARALYQAALRICPRTTPARRRRPTATPCRAGRGGGQPSPATRSAPPAVRARARAVRAGRQSPAARPAPRRLGGGASRSAAGPAGGDGRRRGRVAEAHDLMTARLRTLGLVTGLLAAASLSAPPAGLRRRTPRSARRPRPA